MKIRSLLTAFALLGAIQSMGLRAESGDPQFFGMPPEGGKPLPFSQAVQVGQLLYVSGMIGLQPGTMQPVAGGVGPETRAAMEAIKAVVEKHGSAMDRVVKCTVFLADMKDWPAMNEVYLGFFPTHRPARSAMGVNGLALNARVEIECIAAVK